MKKLLVSRPSVYPTYALCCCGWRSSTYRWPISAEVVAENHALQTGHSPTELHADLEGSDYGVN